MNIVSPRITDNETTQSASRMNAFSVPAFTNDRLAYIDGLRACAALGVICCHTALITPIWGAGGSWPSNRVLAWLGHALFDGAHGVDLFFVLSRFCTSLTRRWHVFVRTAPYRSTSCATRSTGSYAC